MLILESSAPSLEPYYTLLPLDVIDPSYRPNQPLIWLNDGSGRFSALKVHDFVGPGDDWLLLKARLVRTRHGYSYELLFMVGRLLGHPASGRPPDRRGSMPRGRSGGRNGTIRLHRQIHRNAPRHDLAKVRSGTSGLQPRLGSTTSTCAATRRMRKFVGGLLTGLTCSTSRRGVDARPTVIEPLAPCSLKGGRVRANSR